MADVIPSEKNMFRLIIRSRAGQMIRGKRNGPEPRQPRNWLRQVGIVAASLVFLPVALFSVAVFVGLFLVILVAAIAYGLWLRSGLQRMESHQVTTATTKSSQTRTTNRSCQKEKEARSSESEVTYRPASVRLSRANSTT